MTTPEKGELKRQRTLAGYEILGSRAEPAFDELAALAASICQTPIARIGMMAADRLWLKAAVGQPRSELPRSQTVCDRTVNLGRTLVIADLHQDLHWAGHAKTPGDADLRFYAGAPLIAGDGSVIGTVAVMDHQPGQLTAAQQAGLERIAGLVMELTELRRRARRDDAGPAQKRFDRQAPRPDCPDRATNATPAAGPPAGQRTADVDPELLQGILATATDAIITIDESGQIESANPMAGKLFGYVADELPGQPVDQLIPPSRRHAHRGGIQRYLATGKPHMLGQTARLQGLHREGHEFPVELSISEIRLAGGRRVFAGFIRDITRRERDRHALAASEDRFRKVAQVTSDVIWDLSLDGGLLWWSEGLSKTFGYPMSEVRPELGWWSDRIHPEDRDAVVASLKAALADARSEWASQYRFRRHDGSFARVRDSGLIVRDASERPIRMVGGMRDLTDEEILKDQLAHARRLEALGQLTGGIAHDFNNLLTVILGNAELLREVLDNDDSRPLAQLIQSAAQRGAELTARLLAFARRQTLEPHPTDIRWLIAGMQPLLDRSLPEAVAVQSAHADDLWLADIDPAQLESAVLNLVLNARDALPGGGQVRIETANRELDQRYVDQNPDARPGQYVEISVSDNGEGIDPAHMARLFEPFFTTKPKGKGTGLGLPMVYGFIKQSHGHISVESQPGTGTTVRMYLPRSAASAAHGILPPENIEPARGTERVLVAEDDELVLRHARRLLIRLGYQVETARDGSEALARLERGERFDLLFTDVLMPGPMKGPDLARAAQRLNPDIRVLYTSGYTEDTVLVPGHSEAGVHLLQKPYQRADLARKVREALDAA